MRAGCIGLLLLAGMGFASCLAGGQTADVLYPVDIVVSTTSDWTDVRLLDATLVVESWAVEQGVGAPNLKVTASGSLAISKTSFDATPVTVRVRGYIANPTATSIRIWIDKGHIGDTAVSLYGAGEAVTFARFVHRGIVPGNPADNARTFSLTTAELVSQIEPRILPAPSASTPGGKKVLAFYYPWYGMPTGPSGRWVHWNPAHANYDATHVPLTGYYDSLEPETVRRQIRQAKAAGIDGFIASWWGLNSFEDRAFHVLLRVAEEESFLVTVYVEDAATPAQIVTDVSAIVFRYALSPAFLSIDGRPVVFFYVRVAEKFTIDEWRGVFAALDANGRSVFAIGDRLDPTYLQAFQGLHTYNPVGMTLEETRTEYAATSLAARIQGDLFAATVIPGYQEGYPGATGPVSDRAGGETYRTYWDRARASAPQWILITGWNEWHEGTEIEPSVEFGAAYLEYTAEEAAAWRAEDLPPASAAPDRDGDGVPDAVDLCPDWPGSAATNGC
ncbi:MAG: glycoside hydrolase family 99-like domain-containing protein [Candidatus Bipolaricaulota bacterium]|nr:glycoside hydrolase family 99-like domain-containing protein [Candidatus Bipolaricaulota bacterium]